MADIVTGTVSGAVDISTLQSEHADIRREAAVGFDRLNADVLKAAWLNSDATKDARYDVITNAASTANDISKQVDAIDDTLTAAIHTVSRDTMDLRAQVTGVGYQVRDGFVAAAKDAEINALKTQNALAHQSTYLSDKIDADGEKTRALINNLQYQDLNRALIERNAELVEERHFGRHWRGNFDQAQWASLNSQLQAFQSSLQETRQGMVNFGTMAGVGQTSTSNNVR